MAVFSKDHDIRVGTKIYAYTAGTEVPAAHLDAAREAGVVKEDTDEGAAKNRAKGDTGKA